MMIRKFTDTDKGMLMDKNGEFIHMNDIILMFMKKQEFLKSCIKMHEDRTDETGKSMREHYISQSQLVDEFINNINKGTAV